MSLVGPRPERPEFVERFRQQIPGYMQKHLVKAGHHGLGAGQRPARRQRSRATDTIRPLLHRQLVAVVRPAHPGADTLAYPEEPQRPLIAPALPPSIAAPVPPECAAALGLRRAARSFRASLFASCLRMPRGLRRVERARRVVSRREHQDLRRAGLRADARHGRARSRHAGHHGRRRIGPGARDRQRRFPLRASIRSSRGAAPGFRRACRRALPVAHRLRARQAQLDAGDHFRRPPDAGGHDEESGLGRPHHRRRARRARTARRAGAHRRHGGEAGRRAQDNSPTASANGSRSSPGPARRSTRSPAAPMCRSCRCPRCSSWCSCSPPARGSRSPWKRHRTAALPAVLALLFVAAWLLLDAQWMWNLVRQVGETRAQYGGKDWRERHLADGGRSALPVHREGSRKNAGVAGARVRGGRRQLLSADAPPTISIRTTCISIRAKTAFRPLRRCGPATSSSSTSGAAFNSTRTSKKLRFEGGEPVSCGGAAGRAGRRALQDHVDGRSRASRRSRAAMVAGHRGRACAATCVACACRARRNRVDRRRRVSGRRVPADAVDARAVARRHQVRDHVHRIAAGDRRRSPAPLSRGGAHGNALPHALREAAIELFAAPGLAPTARWAWRLLLAWLAVRFILLGIEVVSRPLYPWDAWTQWATKARVWYELGYLAPFARVSGWLAANGAAYFDAAPEYPPTMPLLQVWSCLALGRWDDVLMNWPWWQIGVALTLAVYGGLRSLGVAALAALVGAFLVASLPLANAHVALAGYADLPLAAWYTAAALAFLRWNRSRDWRDAARRAAPRGRLHADQESGLVLGGDARARPRRGAAAAVRRSHGGRRVSRPPAFALVAAARFKLQRVQLPDQPQFRPRVGRSVQELFSARQLAPALVRRDRRRGAGLAAVALPRAGAADDDRGRRLAVPVFRVRIHQRELPTSPIRRR